MPAKYWEIRESYGDKSSKVQEAYECGYEEGYESAMKEMGMGHEMGMRSGSMGMRRHYGMRDGEMGERSVEYGSESGTDNGSMGYRRGRDSMGRYR